MKNGIIIAGFATVGKTYISKKNNNIIDLESGNYKYDYTGYENIPYEKRKGMNNRKLNSNWPSNYYTAINEAQRKYDIVLVQLHPLHLDYFDNNNIDYYIVYPDINDFEYVRKRCLKRGNNLEWINRLENVFLEFYKISNDSKCIKILTVGENKSLEEILKEEKFI